MPQASRRLIDPPNAIELARLSNKKIQTTNLVGTRTRIICFRNGNGPELCVLSEEFTAEAAIIHPSNTPSLMISLSTSGETGTLQIQTDAPEARVKIDGKIRKEAILNGTKTVLLDAGTHRIQVFAPGYIDSEEREVNILKGTTTNQVFTLRAQQAELILEYIEPGAIVYQSAD